VKAFTRSIVFVKSPVGRITIAFPLSSLEHTEGEKGEAVALARPPTYFFVFRLYKQPSRDNRVALEIELAATFYHQD
jgi:hypothetical protein